MGTERGTHKVRTLGRREATERVHLTFMNAVLARPWDGPSAKDVRVVLPDVSSPAAMAEEDSMGKSRLHTNKADFMKHGLTEGRLGCRSFAEGNPSQKGSERKDTPRDAVHDSKLKSPRQTKETTSDNSTAAESSGAPTVPVPPLPDEVQDVPMDAMETSRKRSAEDAGHETDDAGRGGVQPDPRSMAGDCMQEARRRRTLRLAELLEQGKRHLEFAFSSSILGRRRRGTSRA